MAAGAGVGGGVGSAAGGMAQMGAGYLTDDEEAEDEEELYRQMQAMQLMGLMRG